MMVTKMNFSSFFMFALMLSAAAPFVKSQCDIPSDILRTQRVDAIREYVFRTQAANISEAMKACRFYEEDVAFQLRGIGDFSGKLVATEYMAVLFPLYPGNVPTIRLENTLDESTLDWQTEDFVGFYQGGTAYFKYNATLGKYTLVVGGIRNQEFIGFTPCSTNISSDYVVNDPIVMPLFNGLQQPPVSQICGGIVAVCKNGTAGMDLHQYDSYQDCVDYISSKNTPCPYPISSDTKECRSLHLLNSMILPIIHCPHTGKESVMCVDRCLPACSDCASRNATCDVQYPNLTTPVYSCKCKDGFTGDGISCNLKKCSSNYQCGNFAGCSNSTCVCQSTFAWNPTLGTCECPEKTRLRWHSGKAQCVDEGRCVDRTDCYAQSYTQVMCKDTVPPNQYTPFKACLCNEGFTGGWQTPCSCPTNSRIFWIGGSQYCAAPGQCTRDSDCAWYQDCVPQSGSVFGLCASAA